MSEEVFDLVLSAIQRETPKAYHVRTVVGTEHWVPKSQLVALLDEGDEQIMRVRYWWAQASKVERDIELAYQRIEHDDREA